MSTRIIDLSHLLNENVSVYPGTIGPKLRRDFTVEKHGYAELVLTTVLHAGTHIDAPCHIVKNSPPLDTFPLTKFIGDAILIDCRKQKEISLEFLRAHEKNIARVKFILFFTGWQNKWKTDAYFDDCPTLTIEAAHWLSEFDLNGIGFDSFSIDPVISADVVTEETLPRHFIFLGKNILLIENLTNLDQLPDSIFSFQCLPLKIEDADGSPVRAIAIVENTD